MELAHRWISRDLTKLELIISLIVLSIFIGIFSRYMFIVFSKVEKNMIDRTVVNINTAISYHAAFAVLKGDNSYIYQIENTNPMDLMTDGSGLNSYTFKSKDNNSIGVNYHPGPPLNYGGEVVDDTELSLESGKWYFDKDDHFLFYNLNSSEYFKSNIDGPPRVRYKLQINYTDQNNDNAFTPSIDKYLSVKLHAMDSFEWTF